MIIPAGLSIPRFVKRDKRLDEKLSLILRKRDEHMDGHHATTSSIHVFKFAIRLYRLHFLLVICLSVGAVGCSTQAAFTYPLRPPIKVINPNPPNAKIACIPATDHRGMKNRTETLMLSMIPLVPYATAHVDRPEAVERFMTMGKFQFNAREDIPKAVAQHFQEAGIAKSVFFDYGGGVTSADYVLETELIETRWDAWMTFYMLGPPGDLLWWLGLPAGSSSFHLHLNLRLKDKSEKVVWESSVIEDWKIYQSLYYNLRRDTEGIAITLQSGLDRMLAEKPIILR